MRSVGTNNRIALACVLLLSLPACQDSPKVQARKDFLKETIVPGGGIGPIRIGRTSIQALEVLFGKADKHERSEGIESGCNNGDCRTTPYQILTLSYEAESLWFEFRGPVGTEPLLERMAVGCQDEKCPFTGETSRGIRLGDSREKLTRAHGRPLNKSHNNWIVFYRSGIGFGFKDKQTGERWPAREDRINSIQVLGRNHPNLN